MNKYIVLVGVIILLLLSFYLLDSTKKYERKEPTKEQLRAEEKAYCMEGCDWDGGCIERRC
jgi:hypothetical protein